MHLEEVFTVVAVAFEVAGAGAMIVGFIIAAVLGARALLRGDGGRTAFSTLRTTLGSAILLGLEVLVAADLVRTITSRPSIEDAVILAIVVLIRTVLSISIQIEIEGVVPWKRALLSNGAQQLGEAVVRDREASQRAAGGKYAPRG